jgi:dienelactone hydrolase
MKRLAWLAVLFFVTFSARAAVVLEEVRYKDGNTALTGYIAYDNATKEKRPGIFVVHEWWGVTEHVKDYARALAAKGYTAFVADMYGKVAADRKEAGELMGAVMGTPEVMKARYLAAKSVLVSHPTVDPKRLGAIGFSMGSSVVLNVARMGEDLAGVVSVYGGLATRTPAQPGTMKSRVLVLHAVGDPFVKAESIDAFRNEMKAANVAYRFVDYPGVQHGFANPDATANGKKFEMPISYNAEADRKAREAMIAFFSEVFGKR